jgi:hypothetical protein
MRQVAIGVVFALFMTVCATATARADQTVIIGVPVNFTNIPPMIGQMQVICSVYPSSTQPSQLQSYYGVGLKPVASGWSQTIKFTASTYSGKVAVPVPFLDLNLVGVSQPLPYICLVNLYMPNAAVTSNYPALDPSLLKPILAQPLSLTVTGMIPLQ